MPDELPDALALDVNPSTRALRAPLASLLRRCFPSRGLVLEVGSGNGEHVVYLSGRLPHLSWQPSDPDPRRRAIIERWIETTSAENVRAPLDLDVGGGSWPISEADAMLCCNLLHSAPVEAIEGTMRGAARVLPPGGPLVVCGLFLSGGDPPGVLDYDARLRAHDSSWGVRSLDEVLACAAACGLRLRETREMPVDHLAMVLERGRTP